LKKKIEIDEISQSSTVSQGSKPRKREVNKNPWSNLSNEPDNALAFIK